MGEKTQRMQALLLCLLPIAACQFDGSTRANSEHDGNLGAINSQPPDADGTLADAAPDAFVSSLANCQEILAMGRSTGDGIYTIDSDGPAGQPAYQVYCDMSTEGGGWTLVYAYTFTTYNLFATSGNAVIPRPSWTITDPGTSVPVSTTAPTSTSDFGAIDFPLWQELGDSFLVKSNINHWLSCDEGTGSLVREVAGSIDCKLSKVVASACTDVVPDAIQPLQTGRGPILRATGLYYYWDGITTINWPTHDPCGLNQANQLLEVDNPYGAIFVRHKVAP